MADQSEAKWDLPAAIIIASLIALAIFLVALFGPSEMSTRLSNAGQALGVIAGAAAIIAVVYTSHQLELQRQALKDQAEASRAEQRNRVQEELRRAYAEIFATTEELLTIGTAAIDVGDDSALPDKLMTRLQSVTSQAWGIQLLDTDESRVKRLKALTEGIVTVVGVAFVDGMDHGMFLRAMKLGHSMLIEFATDLRHSLRA
jgi:hypothetical protein